MLVLVSFAFTSVFAGTASVSCIGAKGVAMQAFMAVADDPFSMSCIKLRGSINSQGVSLSQGTCASIER